MCVECEKLSSNIVAKFIIKTSFTLKNYLVGIRDKKQLRKKKKLSKQLTIIVPLKLL